GPAKAGRRRALAPPPLLEVGSAPHGYSGCRLGGGRGCVQPTTSGHSPSSAGAGRRLEANREGAHAPPPPTPIPHPRRRRGAVLGRAHRARAPLVAPAGRPRAGRPGL